MSGISNQNSELEKNERNLVLKTLLPKNILKDYENNAISITEMQRLKRFKLIWLLVKFIERFIFKIEKKQSNLQNRN